MKVSVLSSGSKGNTTYIESDSARILIDIGNCSKYVTEKLEGFNIEPSSLDAILITHAHQDHIKGLKVFEKKYHIPVYMTKNMINECDYEGEYIDLTTEFDIKDLHIIPVKTSHDAADSRGFVVTCKDSSVVYITDTGYINRKYFDLLSNRSLYIMESNHDIEMLNNSNYPFSLRKRILSDKGHLSNYDCSKYLTSMMGSKTKCIMLAHLSHENNTEELALETLKNKLKENNILFSNIIIAKQNENTELINI